MTGNVEQGPIIYSIATLGDVEDMARLIGTCFSKYDPPAVAAGFTAEHLSALVRTFGSKIDDERLSIVARHQDTGEILGASLVEDFGTAPPDGLDLVAGFFEPMFELMQQLDDKYLCGKDVKAGDVLHFFMIGVRDDYTGNGIADAMVCMTLKAKAAQGYRAAISESTSEASRRVFKKNGFVERFFEPYETFEFRGQFPFQSIGEHGGCALMELELPDKKGHS